MGWCFLRWVRGSTSLIRLRLRFWILRALQLGTIVRGVREDRIGSLGPRKVRSKVTGLWGGFKLVCLWVFDADGTWASGLALIDGRVSRNNWQWLIFISFSIMWVADLSINEDSIASDTGRHGKPREKWSYRADYPSLLLWSSPGDFLGSILQNHNTQPRTTSISVFRNVQAPVAVTQSKGNSSDCSWLATRCIWRYTWRVKTNPRRDKTDRWKKPHYAISLCQTCSCLSPGYQRPVYT